MKVAANRGRRVGLSGSAPVPGVLRAMGVALVMQLVSPALAHAQMPGSDYAQTDAWWSPDDGQVFASEATFANSLGRLQTLLANGPMATQGHAFFSAIGSNGRACVSCHQPSDSMSLSVQSAQRRWQQTQGRDPLFAAIDGSNCPTLPQAERASHSLLLDHGLFRIQRDWPPRDWQGEVVTPDFKLDVVRDPTGCNTGKVYGLHAAQPSVSVYRRPRPVANMKYLLAMGFAYDPKEGMPLPLDPETHLPVSGNLMSDKRAPTLRAQMNDAAAVHLQLQGALTESQRKQIEDFELRVYSAQISSHTGVRADAWQASGGPRTLLTSSPGQLGSVGVPVWAKEYGAWDKLTDADKARMSARERDFVESVARGAKVFRDRMFLITDSAGINSPMGFGNPVRNSCVFCHNMSQMGNDVAPGQVDIGTTTLPFMDPAPHLPLFRITCQGKPNPHYGRIIYSSDPGLALTTGKCADVGRITMQSMRGLSARAPYFSNGSAPDLRTIIDYYDRRYAIGYTEQEKQDLVNLMSVL